MMKIDDDDYNNDDNVLLEQSVPELKRRKSKNSIKTKQEIRSPSIQLDTGITQNHPYLSIDENGIARPNLMKKNNINHTLSSSSSSIPIPSLSESKQYQKELKKQLESTTGLSWFNLPATDITPEIKNDLLVLKNRSVLNPKRFYKREDKRRKELPKYFQIGTIKEGPTEFYSSRIPRKQRKQHIVDELLEDAESRNYIKKKFTEIQAHKQNFTRRKKPNLIKLRQSRK